MQRGFTLIELLLVIGIIAILAAVVIVAINPTKQLEDTRDARRQHNIKQLQSAFDQYWIDKGYYPGGSGLPDGRPVATPICREGISTGGCTNYDGLVPTYIAELPVDANEENTDSTGYLIYEANGRAGVISEYLSDCGFPGLVGYWHLNEGGGTSAADASGYGNHGTLMGMDGSEWITDTPAGSDNPYALAFDGIAEHIQVDDDPSLNPSALTIGVWVKLSDTVSGQGIIRKYTGGSSSIYGLAQNSGTMSAQVRDENDVLISASAPLADTASWHHIAMTYSNTTVTLYIDGIEVATDSDASLITPNTSGVPLEFGQQGGSARYQGFLDDIRIYNRVLSARQIATLAGCVGW